MHIDGRATQRYLHIGIIILAMSGAAAVFLNFQGVACLTAIARADRQIYSQQTLEEMERSCFIITNSYVYSLFGVIAGAILVVIWVAKKRKKSDDS